MPKSEGEKKREAVLKDAKSVRDLLLNAQMMIPRMIAEMNAIIEKVEPPKPEPEKPAEEEAEGEE